MLPSFKHLKNCDNRTIHLVNGYINNAQKLFAWNENSYFIIPPLINQICLLFYWIQFAFNKQFIGRNLVFLDNKTIKKINTSSHSLCAIGESISRDLCDIFRIEYQLKDHPLIGFCAFIGFCGDKIIDSTSKMLWNYPPGYQLNRSNSVGLSLNSGDKNKLCLFNDEVICGELQFSSTEYMKKGDKFMLEFNFVDNQCLIYYNGKYTGHSLTFDYPQIIPLVSLCYLGEVIEITKYEFRDI